jgi:hypothetical protein
MQQWEYTQLAQVRDPKSGVYVWADHANWKMHAIIRLAKHSEWGWELAAAYPLDNGDRIVYLLKRPTGQDPAG